MGSNFLSRARFNLKVYLCVCVHSCLCVYFRQEGIFNSKLACLNFPGKLENRRSLGASFACKEEIRAKLELIDVQLLVTAFKDARGFVCLFRR